MKNNKFNPKNIYMSRDANEVVMGYAHYDLSEQLKTSGVEDFDSFLSYIEHFNDFECIAYCVIDETMVYVCDEISGDVIGKYDTVKDFTADLINSFKESEGL